MKYIPVSTEEEKLFAARIADLIRLSGRDGERKYSGFLDLRQKEIARFTAQKYGANFSFFGGFENADSAQAMADAVMQKRGARA